MVARTGRSSRAARRPRSRPRPAPGVMFRQPSCSDRRRPALLGAARRTAAGSRTTSSRPTGVTVHPVVVPAQPDVVDARRPHGRAHSGRPRRPGSRSAAVGAMASENSSIAARSADIDPGLPAPASTSSCPRADGRETKDGTNVIMQTPPLSGSRASTSSGTLRGMITHRPGRGVGEDHRGRRDRQGIAHRGRRDVGQIDQHAEPVHLADDLTAELGQPAVPRLVGGRVGPVGVLVVGEGQVADPEPVERSQRAEGVVDAVAALGPEQAGDPAALLSPSAAPRPR